MSRMPWGALCTVALALAPAVVAAQQPAPAGDSTRATMQERMREWDQRLEQKLAEVDRAKGDEKVAAMAEALRELMAQRREMHERMAEPGAGSGPAAGPCGARPETRGAGMPDGGWGMNPGRHAGHPMPGAGPGAMGGDCPMRAAADSGSRP